MGSSLFQNAFSAVYNTAMNVWIMNDNGEWCGRNCIWCFMVLSHHLTGVCVMKVAVWAALVSGTHNIPNMKHVDSYFNHDIQ
jgi:hypothetical protein